MLVCLIKEANRNYISTQTRDAETRSLTQRIKTKKFNFFLVSYINPFMVYIIHIAYMHVYFYLNTVIHPK